MALQRNKTSNHKIKQFVIVLDAGHGQGKAHNRGSVCSNEGDNNFYYSLILKREFEKVKGVKVILTRNKISDNPSLDVRGRIGLGADLLLSLHSNAFKLTSVNGTVILDSVRFPNRLLATKLVNNISKLFDSLNRGVQFKEGQKGWDWYGILRCSKAKSSMIIEHGFHTNLKDCNYFKNNHTTIAKTTVNTIVEHYGLGGSNQNNSGGIDMEGNKAFYNINVNNQGLGVLQLQRDLVELNYDIGSYGRNGIFGKDTESAVKHFQKDYKLEVDGSAGPSTLKKLREVIENKNNSSLETEVKILRDTLKQIHDLSKQ